MRLFQYFNRKGLSLIELMVVIAIIGLSLTFAVPMYTTHVNKVNVSQVVNKLGTYKLDLVDAYSSTATWPAALNGATAPATVANSDFDSVVNFRYNTNSTAAWWGYQLSAKLGSGWVFMVLIANPDGTFTTHCGSLSATCTFGSCNSLDYFPAGCNETGLSATYSLADS